ncbi:MAG TPA: methyltransferase [Caulobacteraceae bacterium]|jgi:predicted methyltransferase|nr:methyltransferase [Caulobacteraceae bacterium]
MRKTAPFATRRGIVAGGASTLFAGAMLAACGRVQTASNAAADDSGPSVGTLQWAVAGNWRAADRPQDRWRHPEQTLLFFGVGPGATVVEVWPGRGYWTEILAPYLAHNDGVLYAANFQLGPHADPAQAEIVSRFKERFDGDRELYGALKMTQFGPTSGPLAPAGSADLVLFMETVNAWMGDALVDKAFRDAFAALKPGGILGVEQHRAQPDAVQDPSAASGYVTEAYVKKLAEEAGFVFSASSEINANPKDTKDHPFGVWTLPPTRLSAPRGQPENPNFNHAKYDLIGESDRMTLKFRKPR